MRARARGAPLPNPTPPFPTSLPLILVVNPGGQRCTAHARPLSVARPRRACVCCVTRHARPGREREQNYSRQPRSARGGFAFAARTCNGSCQAERVVTPRKHARTQKASRGGSRSSDGSRAPSAAPLMRLPRRWPTARKAKACRGLPLARGAGLAERGERSLRPAATPSAAGTT